jgi:hypothetical protein
MTIRALLDFLHTMHPDREVYVHLFKADRTREDFKIIGFSDHHGDAVIDIAEEGFEGVESC